MNASEADISCQCKDQAENQTITEWCITCNLPFCGICVKIHNEAGNNIRTKHSFINIETNCCEHSEEFTHYCCDHRNVCCKNCIRENHVRCEKPLPVSESLSNVLSSIEFYEVERGLRELTQSYDRLVENRLNNIKTVEEQTKLTIMLLNNTRNDLINRVNFLVDDLIGIAEHVSEITISDMNKLVKDVKESNEHVRSLKTSFEKMKDNVSNLQIFMAMKQVSSKLSDAQNKAEDFCKQEAADETMAILHINSHFQEILSGSYLLGEIKMLRSPCEIQVGSWKFRQAQQIANMAASRTFSDCLAGDFV